jgi:hypothetical protein
MAICPDRAKFAEIGGFAVGNLPHKEKDGCSETYLRVIAPKYGANPDWLITGEGEMLLKDVACCAEVAGPASHDDKLYLSPGSFISSIPFGDDLPVVSHISLEVIEYEEERNRDGFPRRIRLKLPVPPDSDRTTVLTQAQLWVREQIDGEFDYLKVQKERLTADISALSHQKESLLSEIHNLAATVVGLKDISSAGATKG